MTLAGSEKSYSWTFFLVSQVLIILTIYSLYDEGIVRRPWKVYQQQFNALQRQVAVQELEDLKKQYKEQGTEQKILELEMQLEKAEIARESDDYKTNAAKLDDMQIEYDDADLQVKFSKSVLDNRFYEYKHALLHGEDYSEKEKAYKDLDLEIKEKTLKLGEQKREVDKVRALVLAYDGKLKELNKKIDELNQPLMNAQTKIDSIDFRPIEISQIVVDDFGKGGNISWGRVDRCMTCHVSVDKPGFEDVAKALKLSVVKDDAALMELIKQKPEMKDWAVTEKEKNHLQKMFGTHPRTQELLAKHPVEQFGCTTCHGGDGRGLIIKGKAFGEEDKAHAFHHHAVEPLLRGPQMESNCLACHMGQIEVGGAKNLTKGLELFVQLGCQNCHAVDGYDKLFRVGPELNKVGSKVTTAWLVDWLKNPFNYMPNSRMPNFNFNDDEVVALASYLVANSEPHAVKDQMTLGGDAVNGEKIFNTVGCQGCHSAKSDEATYAIRSRASNLSRLSAKVKNAQWVYDWIKDPKNYAAHARMPDLRLTDREAADVTAFLMRQNPDYKKTLDGRAGVLAGRVDPHNQELINQGKVIINNRGCYSCHTMKGFENGERIGPNLTAEALKENFEFDFGDALQKNRVFKDAFGHKIYAAHLKETPGELTSSINERAKASYKGKLEDVDGFTNIVENWQSWIRNKLRFPTEIFQHERAELKMPNFNLAADELDALVVFLNGLTSRNVPFTFNAAQRDRYKDIIAGQQLVAEKNCLGCHAIMDFGGDINVRIDEFDNAEFGALMQHYPPELTHVGMKIRPEWLSQYLKDPSMPYRPAVYVRMPSFGFNDTQVNTLIRYFAGMAKVSPALTGTDYHLDPELIATGKTLASNESGFACFVCHLIDGKKPGDDMTLWAPDWENVRAKLQYDFIPKWIQDPQHFQKFSVMPGFLTTPETALPGILDGKADKQLEALRAYLLSVGAQGTYDEMKPESTNSSAAPMPAPSAVETDGGVQ